MQDLAAGSEGADAEARDGRCVLVEHRDPFVEREPFEQVVDTLAQR
nr:hypothetical protein [Streptomyces sp. DSM 41633]